GISDDYAFAEEPPDRVEALIREVAADRPDAIAILCTNMRGAPLVSELEAEYDIPIHDSVAVAVWKSLKLAGVDPRRVKGWGRVFAT
ncbi:MAG TPA: Asp/Glu/hydantoin racemase, partial [Xanthobacteraceae bacterium]|nr:Asp/Glu/hydantoin racemase [Xanthobacteraceae bacterium]